MGARGALVCDEKGLRRFPSFPVRAVDTTGAGDAFTSALTVEYLRTGDIYAAMPVALAAGALTVTRLGAQPAMPDHKEVFEFLSHQLSLPHPVR
jgi:ribokinase